MKNSPALMCVLLCALLFAVQTNAVHLSTDGTGEVLIFPYYTVNGGFNTLLTLTNTTDEAKALRVRFREAANSREVFAFNLYLGPNDMWSGALLKGNEDEDFYTKLITNDESCTLPKLNQDYSLFKKAKFIGNFDDSYGDDTKRLHEGFIEVIEMGVMTGDSADAAMITDDVATPVNCGKLRSAWYANQSASYWVDDPTIDMQAPSGGLTGSAVLINVAQGLAVSQEPTAINDFSDEVLNFVFNRNSPSLASGKATATVIDSDGSSFSSQWPTGFQALSAVLTKSSIYNEYVLTGAIGAETDWIITMPTRQFHIDDSIAIGNTPVAPFRSIHNRTGEIKFNDCESFEIENLFDREENNQIVSNLVVPGVSPPMIITDTVLCHSTNVVSFIDFDEREEDILYGVFSSKFPLFKHSYWNTTSTESEITSGFISTRAPNQDEGYFDNGWVISSFEQSTDETENANFELLGLPMIGFSVQKYVNHSLGGGTILANYAGLFKNKSIVTIEASENPSDDLAIVKGMQIDKGGVGQVLIYPYYTVNNEFNTLISVVNTSDQVKALKIRFREGKNARDVLDFNLYLSPYDVWTAALVPQLSTISQHEGEESVILLTSDNSCTVPNNISGQEFLPYGFDPLGNGGTASGYDGLGTNMQRATEGFFEIIEMGGLTGAGSVFATHVSGIPANCSGLEENWSAGGKWVLDPNDDIREADGTGGLYGSVGLINVRDGTDMSHDAVAIVGYNTSILHAAPGSFEPNLSSGNSSTTLIETDDGVVQTTWSSPLDAVSALFMQESVANEYTHNPFIKAQTDWVNIYPTKQFYVDSLYTNNSPNPPFSQPVVENKGACEELSFVAYNREQTKSFENNPVPSPVPPGNYDTKHCWSVNVACTDNSEEFATSAISEKSILGSNRLTENWGVFTGNSSIYNLNFTEGWMENSFSNQDLTPSYLEGVGADGSTHKIYGKPVLGFVVQRYVNGVLGDEENPVLANYAVLNKNKSKRKFEITNPQGE